LNKNTPEGINKAFGSCHIMKIREFQIKDKTKIINLWKECDLVVPWNNPEQDIDRKLKVDPDLFLVGEKNGEIIASVMGGYEGHRGWINYLAISLDHRRQGYGKKIMREVEKRLIEIGCPKINLQIRDSNTDVIAFYVALGYGEDHVIGLGKTLKKDKPFVG